VPLLQIHPSTHLSVTSHLYESQSHFLHFVLLVAVAVAAVHFVLLVASAAAHLVLLVAVAAVEHFQLS
jgi:hypothetical protein